jgi:hypothetical protein
VLPEHNSSKQHDSRGFPTVSRTFSIDSFDVRAQVQRLPRCTNDRFLAIQSAAEIGDLRKMKQILTEVAKAQEEEEDDLYADATGFNGSDDDDDGDSDDIAIPTPQMGGAAGEKKASKAQSTANSISRGNSMRNSMTDRELEHRWDVNGRTTYGDTILGIVGGASLRSRISCISYIISCIKCISCCFFVARWNVNVRTMYGDIVSRHRRCAT